jgi:hypothetical protein
LLGYDCFCTEAKVQLGCSLHDSSVAEQAVTLLGGPRNGELEMVRLNTTRIDVVHTPDLSRPEETIRGTYERIPITIHRPNGKAGHPYSPTFMWKAS